jgi:hypothetical protein
LAFGGAETADGATFGNFVADNARQHECLFEADEGVLGRACRASFDDPREGSS